MMHRSFRFILLFVVTQLLQAYLFNNLTIGAWFNPLVYVSFLALLPLEMPRGVLLVNGLATGLVADWFMGTAGLNTCVAVFAAFTRPFLLDLLFGKENIRDGGVPSPERFGEGGFLRYAASLVGLHHLLFFLLEALSWAQIGQMLGRWLVSSLVCVGFTWLMARVFTSKLTVRV